MLEVSVVPPIDWRLAWVPIAALAIPLIFGVLTALHARRRDEFDWDVDGDYAIDLTRDRVRFPQICAQQNPVDGDTGIMVKVKFRGRSAITITGLDYEWNDIPNPGEVPVARCTLQDGNSWEQLVFTRDISMDQITAVVIRAEGGRTYRYEINPEYRHRYHAHIGTENP